MATSLNLGKQARNLIRSRVALIQDLAGVYRPALGRRGQKVIEIVTEKAKEASRSEVAGKLRVLKEYYKVEMAPPRIDEMQKLKSDLAVLKEFMTTGCWKQLTVKQAWLMFLVGLEVGMWFYLGETIGKMSFVGYKV